MPIRKGYPRTRSTPRACSRKIRSIVSCDCRRLPPTSPPTAIEERSRTIDRAFPWPPSDPRPACLHEVVLATAAPNEGFSSVFAVRESGGGVGGAAAGGGGGVTFAIRGQSLSVAPI